MKSTIAESGFSSRCRPPASVHPHVSRGLHVLTFYYNGSPDILAFDLYCPCRSCAYYMHLDMYLFNNIPRLPSPPLPSPKSRGFLFHLFIFIYLPPFSPESARPSDHHPTIEHSSRPMTATVLYLRYDMHTKPIWL